MLRGGLLHKPLVVTVRAESARGIPASIRSRTASSIIAAGNGITEQLQKPKPKPKPSVASARLQSIMVHSAPLLDLGRRLRVRFRPTPQLGLLSLFFVLSTAVGAIISLAIMSIPTVSAFRRLAGSMDKLVQVVSEEVPGTLSSLNLSGLEISDLTQQLSNLRQKISGNFKYGKNDRQE